MVAGVNGSGHGGCCVQSVAGVNGPPGPPPGQWGVQPTKVQPSGCVHTVAAVCGPGQPNCVHTVAAVCGSAANLAAGLASMPASWKHPATVHIGAAVFCGQMMHIEAGVGGGGGHPGVQCGVGGGRQTPCSVQMVAGVRCGWQTTGSVQIVASV